MRITFRRLFAVAVPAALASFLYLRPLTLFFTARSLYLRAIGMESAFTEVGGRRIHYWTVGEGPPLVLVHGVAMRAEDWAPLFRALKQRHRIYAPDLLGYGESAQPRDGDYSVAAQAELVRGFLNVMELEQPDVAGVSMGGWIALKLAAEHPERVKRLVLISSAGLAFASTLTETSFSATTIEEQRRSFRLQSDLAGRFPDFILRDFLRHSRKKAWIVRASMRSMLERQDLLMDGKLQRVRMPVLIIAGTADRIVPFDVALRLKREMPHATLVPLPGCGHLAVVECRAATLDAMHHFWTAAASRRFPTAAAKLRQQALPLWESGDWRRRSPKSLHLRLQRRHAQPPLAMHHVWTAAAKPPLSDRRSKAAAAGAAAVGKRQSRRRSPKITSSSTSASPRPAAALRPNRG